MLTNIEQFSIKDYYPKMMNWKPPRTSFKKFIETELGNNPDYLELHKYNKQYPNVLGNSRDFNSGIVCMSRGYFRDNYDGTPSKWNRPPASRECLKQAALAYVEYRIHNGYNTDGYIVK